MSNKIKRKCSLKIISSILIICFTGSSAVHPESAINPHVSVSLSQESPAGLQDLNIPVSNLSIPSDAGRIDEIIPSSPRAASKQSILIHIRDAHGSYEAQVNIKKTIEYLTREYGINTILLEGGAGELNPELLKFFDDEKLNVKVADELAKIGKLSGAELFLVEHANEKSATGIGVEELEAYAQNLQTFREVLGKKEMSDQFIRKLRAQIEMRGSHVFNKELRDFLKSWQAWREERLDLGGFLEVVRNRSIQSLQIDLAHARFQAKYPMLVRFFKAKDLEPKLHRERAEAEKQTLLQLLKNKKIDFSYIEDIQKWDLSKGINGWTSKKLPRNFLEDLYSIPELTDFKITNDPELAKYWASIIFLSELESIRLFDEVEKINQAIFEKLSVSADEINLISLVRDSILLEKLFHLELTRDETAVVQRNQDQLSPYTLLFRLSKEKDSAKIQNQLVQNVEQIFKSALQFYEGAVQREKFIVENVKKILEERKETKAILITGGFHSDGLKAAFAKNKFSYVEISPRMTSVDGVQANYLAAMLDTRKTIFDRAQISDALVLQSPNFRSEIFTKVSPNRRVDGIVPIILNILFLLIASAGIHPANAIDRINENQLIKKSETKLGLAKDPQGRDYLLLQTTINKELHDVVAFPINNFDKVIAGDSLDLFQVHSNDGKITPTNLAAFGKLGINVPGKTAEIRGESHIKKLGITANESEPRSELRSSDTSEISPGIGISKSPENRFQRAVERIVEILRFKLETFVGIKNYKLRPENSTSPVKQDVVDRLDHFLELIQTADYQWRDEHYLSAQIVKAAIRLARAEGTSNPFDNEEGLRGEKFDDMGPYWQIEWLIQKLILMNFDEKIFEESLLEGIIGLLNQLVSDYSTFIHLGSFNRNQTDYVAFIERQSDQIAQLSGQIDLDHPQFSDAVKRVSKKILELLKNAVNSKHPFSKVLLDVSQLIPELNATLQTLPHLSHFEIQFDPHEKIREIVDGKTIEHEPVHFVLRERASRAELRSGEEPTRREFVLRLAGLAAAFAVLGPVSSVAAAEKKEKKPAQKAPTTPENPLAAQMTEKIIKAANESKAILNAKLKRNSGELIGEVEKVIFDIIQTDFSDLSPALRKNLHDETLLILARESTFWNKILIEKDKLGAIGLGQIRFLGTLIGAIVKKFLWRTISGEKNVRRMPFAIKLLSQLGINKENFQEFAARNGSSSKRRSNRTQNRFDGDSLVVG